VRRFSVVAAFLLAGLFMAGCTPLPSYRYKTIVEVETPQGARTASGVVEVRAHHEVSILPQQGGNRARVIGEALPVDLPDGRTLFVLLAKSEEGMPPEYIAPDKVVRPDERKEYAQMARLLAEGGRKAVLDPSEYPLLARFRDVRRPGSIERIHPDSLEQAFGPGIRIRRIVIESTNEPITRGIKVRLPWLNADNPFPADPDSDVNSKAYFTSTRD
jgi:hypothetical protein